MIKIISGGQTGVDQGALDFALGNNLLCGGWCPKGRLSENGRIPLKYPLVELNIGSYASRTERNVNESDGTLIVVKGNGFSDGTKLTARVCEKYEKPFLFFDIKIIDYKTKEIKIAFMQWLRFSKIKILNIAGSRESEVEGIQYDTIKLLNYLFGGTFLEPL